MSIVTFQLEDLAIYGIAKENVKSVTEKLGMSLESLDDKEAIIDITPNRPDMLDITGFGRAANFLLGKKEPREKFYTLKNKPIMEVNVTESVKKIRPFIAVVVAKNVDLSGNRLKNLVNFTEKFCDTYGRKRKKIAIGLYDFEKVNGPLTYTASRDGSFVPLGSSRASTFDEILQSHQKGIEYSSIIKKGRAYPFLKDANDDVLSLIPITNAEKNKITEHTKNLLIEMTGTSENAVASAIKLIACSFLDLGADVYPCEIKYPNKKRITPELDYREIKIKKSRIEKTLGIYMEENKPINLANRLGYFGAKYGGYTLVFVPPYRIDVLNDQDVIEDIAIAYGYENIEPVPIYGTSNALPEESKELSNRVSRLMIGIGFTEAMNPYLTNEQLNFGQMEKKADKDSIISVAYAKTESITMLRTSLLPWMMENLSSSTSERMPQRLFEIGSVFSIDKETVVEKNNISIVAEHARTNYSEIKAVVVELLKLLKIEKYEFKEFKDDTFIPGRAAQIIIDGKSRGYLGEVHPKVLNNFKIEEPVVAAELELFKVD